MAQDDMHVVMYKILAYLYWCMRNGVEPEPVHYANDGDVLAIPYQYWASIIRELQESGYVRGFSVIEAWGGDLIVKAARPSITMQGVEFLKGNGLMQRALSFLKEAKSALPFI